MLIGAIACAYIERINIMKRIFAFILWILVALIMLVGCGDQEVIPKDEDTNLKISSISENTDSNDVVLSVKTEAGEKKYNFDTKNEKLTEYKEKTQQTPNYHIRIEYNNTGLVKVFSNVTNELVFSVDLKSHGFIEEKVNDKVKYYSGSEFSPTGRYLLIKQSVTKKSILIDLKDKKLIKLPIDGYLRLDWANKDKQVILENIKAFGNSKGNIDTYIWYFTRDEIEKIGNEFYSELKWSPDGKHLYYITPKSFDDKDGYSLMLFNNSKWNEAYFTEMSINEETFRWISDNIFIFTARHLTKTRNPIELYLRPWEYFAVKVDYSTNKEVVKKLDGTSISSYAWSNDNKYLYYVQTNKLYKSEVNFGE